MENIKTLGQLLQELVEKDDDRRYSLHEFLLYSNEEDRKRIEHQLAEKDCEQMNEYLNSKNFENKNEVFTAACEYIEHVNQAPLGMGEMGDIWDVVEDYLTQKGLDLPDED